MTFFDRHSALVRGPGRAMGMGQRRHHAGAALLVLGLLLAACGGATGPSRTGSGTTATQAPTRAPAAGAPGAALGISATERLVAALEPLRSGYTFETTVTIGQQVAAHVKGRRFGEGSELAVESGGASITYRLLPPASWVRQPGGDWVEADGTVPGGDPLAALMAPQAATALPGGPSGRILRVSYAPAALGLPGVNPVPVTVTIVAGGPVWVTYTASLGGRETVSTTVLTPQPTQEPIVAPAVAPDPAG